MDKLIETIVGAIEDKKGKNIVSLDLSGFDGAICSRFIVCNADSTTQVGAIAAGIEEKVLEVLGEKVWRIECRVDRHGLCGRGGAHFPDRTARVLPARRVVG